MLPSRDTEDRARGDSDALRCKQPSLSLSASLCLRFRLLLLRCLPPCDRHWNSSLWELLWVLRLEAAVTHTHGVWSVIAQRQP